MKSFSYYTYSFQKSYVKFKVQKVDWIIRLEPELKIEQVSEIDGKNIFIKTFPASIVQKIYILLNKQTIKH